jgi:glycosyltransferase involved in cell wall biosynthesis
MSELPLLIRRIFNRLGRPFGINPFPRAFHYDATSENQHAFEKIYQENFWGSEQSRSGVGSEIAFTDNYRVALTNLIRREKFHRFFDAPCGDLNWMSVLLKEVPLAYEGGDISANLVEELKQRHPQFSFHQFDITRDAFPKADVWHCRDCLFHLPFADIRAALENFVASDIPYALLTTHHAFLLHRNLDLNGIGFRFVDLERPPISLPKPLVYLPDYRMGFDFPRYVGLWSREAIKEALKPILYLVDGSIAITGAFIAARNEARALAETKRIVLVLPKESKILPEELKDFWRVEYLPMVRLSKNVSALLRYVPTLLYSSLRLRRLMKRDNATLLQLNDFYLMHGAILRLLLFKGHIVSWVRCHPRNFAGPLAPLLLWCMKKAANRVIAVSGFIQSLLPKYDAEILYDYYAGTTRAPRTWQENEEKKFVYIGNYIIGKGQDVALKAFVEAAKQDPSITLAFYGGDMGLEKNLNYRKQLEATAQQSGFASRISFHDFVADTYSVLEGAFAALNFSTSESFSMTVLEASGAGLPVIATASGGPQEIIKPDVTGFIIPVGDVAAAAKKILALTKDPTAATRMGQAGAEHIHQSFSSESFRNTLESILH